MQLQLLSAHGAMKVVNLAPLRGVAIDGDTHVTGFTECVFTVALNFTSEIASTSSFEGIVKCFGDVVFSFHGHLHSYLFLASPRSRASCLISPTSTLVALVPSLYVGHFPERIMRLACSVETPNSRAAWLTVTSIRPPHKRR